MNWNPIASAPRDGSNILIRFGQDGTSQAKYIAGLPYPWQFIDTNDGVTWLINHAQDAPGGPSHWMPMPAALASQPAKPADGGGVVADELPPLPEPTIDGSVMHPELKICYLAPVHFTSEQMREYARAALAAQTAAPCVKPVGHVRRGADGFYEFEPATNWSNIGIDAPLYTATPAPAAPVDLDSLEVAYTEPFSNRVGGPRAAVWLDDVRALLAAQQGRP